MEDGVGVGVEGAYASLIFAHERGAEGQEGTLNGPKNGGFAGDNNPIRVTRRTAIILGVLLSLQA